MPAWPAAALVVDGSCAAGAAPVGIAAAAANECSRRVSGALSVLAAEYKTVMPSKK